MQHEHTPEEDRRSMLDGLTGFTWDSTESVSYEAALEAIGELMGAYTAKINSARASAAPDEEAIRSWQDARQRCAEKRRSLNPTDHEEVARVRREYAAAARDLGGR